MKDMKELMRSMSQKKESSDLSEKESQAKMDVLKELLAMASKHAGDSVIDGLKKVTVAAPSAHGLVEGLDQAKALTQKMSSHATTDADASKLSDMMDESETDDDANMHESDDDGDDAEETPEHEATESDEEETAEDKKKKKEEDDEDEEDYY